MSDAATIRAAADAAIADFGAGVREIRERAESARAAMQSASATVSSPDGAVIATVGADGVLTGLSFGAEAASLAHPTLAALVVETSRRAHAAALAEAEQRVAALVGSDTEPVAVLHRDRLAVEPEAPAAASAPEPVDDPEGFAGRGF